MNGKNLYSLIGPDLINNSVIAFDELSYSFIISFGYYSSNLGMVFQYICTLKHFIQKQAGIFGRISPNERRYRGKIIQCRAGKN